MEAEPAIAPSPAQAQPLPVPKEFRCAWGNCTKSFSRAEHLHRHALNHDESRANLTCERCSAVFKRKDLIDRHMARHKEKDEEAGGEGLGKLQTRKRLWRDQTGTVVAKRRPELEKRKRPSGTSRARNPDIDQDELNPPMYREHAPISPPGSLQENGPDAIEKPVFQQQQELWTIPMGGIGGQAGAMHECYDFLYNASWGAQAPENNNSDLIFNDIFAPDTASSFNNPFTTMSYYNWLLGNNSSWSDTNGLNASNDLEMTKLPMGLTQSIPQAPRSSISLSASDSSGEYGHSQYYDVSNNGFKMPVSASSIPSNNYSHEAPTPESSAANQIVAMSQMAESTFAASLGYQENRPQTQAIDPAFMPTPTESKPSYESGRAERMRRTPIVTQDARQGVLDFVHRSRPKAPDDTEITVHHELLQLPVLQEFCDLYFKRFNNAYPLLHQATFEPSQVDPLLLISVLLLGATYSDKESHLFAICLHDVMRAQIFGSLAFNTRPKLWMLQTILLVECFGKSRAGQLQHDMSHLFHGLLINLIRRSDCQSARCISPEHDSIKQRWIAEVEAEQKRRLALLCFMWDTQHAVLFSQSLCMNAAELKLTLPWNEALWEAESAEEWHAIHATERPQPQYLAVLKSYFVPGPEARTLSLNALSRVLMLHGIMSVAWDLNRRDQTSLGRLLTRFSPFFAELTSTGLVTTGKDERWQSRISHSYDLWKSDFDTWSKSHSLALHTPTQKSDFQKSIVATTAIYHSAHIILQVEINDLQIYAGATHIIGRPVTKHDYERSKQRIERWVRDSPMSASKAAGHAARVLRDGIRRLEGWDAGDWFVWPWCLYLAALTVWAFQVGAKVQVQAVEDGAREKRERRVGGEEGSESEEDGDWDARAEMSALVSAMTRSSMEDLWRVAGRYRTGDLPRCVSKYLGTVRWAVVQEGMKVLNGLAGRGRS